MFHFKNALVQFCLGLLAMAALGCGGAGIGAEKVKTGGVTVTKDGTRLVSKKAREDFAVIVQNYEAAEKAGLTPDSCKSVAEKFEKFAKNNANMAEALYNVGAVYVKCDMGKEAKEAFEKTVKVHPDHQLAMTQLAIMQLKAGNDDAAEDLLRKVVGAGQNKMEAVPAYVNAAALFRKRGAKGQQGDMGAMKKAQMNLRRALAIDSKYMPALYQLAMLYLDTAVLQNQSSYLTLATLVCNQGISLNPEYGPIYHALGQVRLEQDQLVEALKAFQTAFTKDPTLFSSYMNYGAINLNFRGYEEAKTAFQRAIALNPDSYDAHMGLGVALRGLGDFTGARAEYKKAAEIEPKRTDYIFNVGLLEMDYENTGTVDGFKKAKSVFNKFLNKATSDHRIDPDGKKGPALSWVGKAEKRIEQCDKNIAMIIEAEKEMAEMEKLAAEQAKREAEMKAQMEKAKALEQKEAAGQTAPPSADEGAADGDAAGDGRRTPKNRMLIRKSSLFGYLIDIMSFFRILLY